MEKKTSVVLVALAGLALGASAEERIVREWRLDGTYAEAQGGAALRPKESGACSFVDGGLAVRGTVLTTPDSPAYDAIPGLRFGGRVRFTDVENPSGWTTLVRKGAADGEVGGYFLRLDQKSENGGRMSFFLNTDGSPEPRVSSAEPIRAGVWYDYEAGWDGTNIFLTVNGKTTRTPRVGPGRGAAGPLRVGPLEGEMRGLRFSAPKRAASSDAELFPGLRISCSVTFDKLPKGETHILGKTNAYLLRYDCTEPGNGVFGFWVWLDGGWEPRVAVSKRVEVGRKYNVAATWDGRYTSLDVDGDGERTRRSGARSPARPGTHVSSKGLHVDDLLVSSYPAPLPELGEFRTQELMPCIGYRFHLRCKALNPGTAASNCTVRARALQSVRVDPAEIALGDLETGAVKPLAWTVDPGTNDTTHLLFEIWQNGKVIGRAGKRTVLMPVEDPDRSARAWSPRVSGRRAYHLDAEAGDDARDGLTPATAWKTFARVKGLTLGPGERLLLKRGCTFRDELVVAAKGAADDWAEIGAYGEGARPIIRRTRGFDERCLLVEDPTCLVVRDLVVCNAGKGIDVSNARGLLVERCLAHHVEGHYRVNAHGIPEWRDKKGAPGGGGAAGICLAGGNPRDVVLRDCEMYQCSAGFKTRGSNVWHSRLFCHDNAAHNTSPHPFCTGTAHAWFHDCVFDASGWSASAGTMGIMLGENDGIVFRNCHFVNQPDSDSHDSGGIDFEANGENCLIDRCTFRNNAGAAIEVLGLRSPQARNTHIRACRFDRNNWANVLGPSEIYVWGGTKDRAVVCSSGLIEGNGYVLAPGVCFYTNCAVSTRADWMLKDNREFANAAELNRAFGYNEPPEVLARGEIWTDQPTVRLPGWVKDDAKPLESKVAVSWQELEGPGRVEIANAADSQSTAKFTVPGDYRLQLRADDGEFWRTARTAVHVLPAGTKVAKAWSFAKNHDTEGWSFANLGTFKEYFKGATVSSGTYANPVHLVCGDFFVLALRDAKEGWVQSPDGLDLRAESVNALVVKMNNRTNSKCMRVAFTTAEHPQWSTENVRTFDIVPDDVEDRVYTVPLAFEGRLNQVRIEFSGDGAPVTGTCRIDYIWLGSPAK